MQEDPQRATSCHQKCLQNCPELFPRRPEGPREPPKRPLRGPKRPPDGLKRPPRSFQEGPRERYSETCIIKLFFHHFFNFFNEKYDYIILYGTIWPSQGWNPMFYSVLWSPSGAQKCAPGGQSLDNIYFFHQKRVKPKKHTINRKKASDLWAHDRPLDLAGGGPQGRPRARGV